MHKPSEHTSQHTLLQYKKVAAITLVYLESSISVFFARGFVLNNTIIHWLKTGNRNINKDASTFTEKRKWSLLLAYLLNTTLTPPSSLNRVLANNMN